MVASGICVLAVDMVSIERARTALRGYELARKALYFPSILYRVGQITKDIRAGGSAENALLTNNTSEQRARDQP